MPLHNANRITQLISQVSAFISKWGSNNISWLDTALKHTVMFNVWTVAVEFLQIKLRGRLSKCQVWDVLQFWNPSHRSRCVLSLNWSLSTSYSTLVHSNFFSHFIYSLSFRYHNRSSSMSGLEKHGCKCGLVSVWVCVPGRGS